jgi:hypothetical protein
MNVHLKEQRRRGQDRRHAVEASDHSHGAFVDVHEQPWFEWRPAAVGQAQGAHALTSSARFNVGTEPLILAVRHARSFN